MSGENAYEAEFTVRSELGVSVRQTVREAISASVAHALGQPKAE